MQQEQLDAAVDGGPGGDGGGGGIIPSRLSPSGRNLSVSQAALAASARHRRSPTAPEQGTTSNGIAPGPGQAQGQQAGKTWTAGDMNGNGKGAVNGNGHGNMAEDGNGQMVQAQVHRTPTTTTTQSQGQLNTAARIKLANMNAARNAGSGGGGHDRGSGGHDRGSGGGEGKMSVRNLVVNKRVYARLDMIGKGGSSRVYRVMNNANEIYAIKRVSLDKTDAETMSGYMNEIALLKRLEGNSRIIRLVDSEVKGTLADPKGTLMLVMECGEIGERFVVADPKSWTGLKAQSLLTDFAKLLLDQQKEPMNMAWIAYYWQQVRLICTYICLFARSTGSFVFCPC